MSDKKPKTKNYKLTGVKHQGFDEDGNPKDYRTGDMVPLTETAYEAFKDKFEPPKEDVEKGAAPGETLKTPTQPQVDLKDAESQAQKGEAPKAEKTDPKSGATGAGASENSSNTAKAPASTTK